jgi:hypothetical protein
MSFSLFFYSGCGKSVMYKIADNGESPYCIVLSDQASPTEKHAAEDLCYHIKLATGAELPIVAGHDSRADEPYRIFLGLGEMADKLIADGEPVDLRELGDEGFIIRTVIENENQPDIVIAGGKLRGTMYGVYTFLEKLGFRWYTPTLTKYPEGGKLETPAIDEKSIPAYIYRDPSISEAFDHIWKARNRVHYKRLPQDDELGGRMGIHGGHTIDRLVPLSLYDEHPEYFPLIGGKRVTGYVQRCFTNEDVIRITAENMNAWMNEDSDWKIFSLGQNDTENLCECPECLRITEEQGAPSGLIVHYTNKVAEIVEKTHPDKFISAFAYTFSEKPPKSIKPRHNVIIQLAPIMICCAHPYTECTAPEAVKFKEYIEGWGRLTNNIFIWHYVTDFPHYLAPFPDFNSFTKVTKSYWETGVKGIFFQGTRTDGGSYPELKAWIMSRQLWDPYVDTDKLIDEWMYAVYGPAFEPMKAAFDLIHTRTAFPEHHLYINDPPSRVLWPDHVVASLDSLSDAGERLAANDSTALYYVQKNRLGVEYLKLILNTGQLKVIDGEYRPTGNTVSLEDYDNFIDYTKRFNVTLLREEAFDASFYTMFRQRLESHRVVTIQNDDISLDIVPDLGGRIIKIIDRRTGKNILHESDNSYHAYPATGGYEEMTALGWGCSGFANSYDAELKGREITLTARNATEELAQASVVRDLIFKRKISLPEKGRKINFSSSIINDSREAKTYRLICRMELETDPEKTTVLTQSADGTFITAESSADDTVLGPYNYHEMRYDGDKKPAGTWRMKSDSERWTIENHFDDDIVETCKWVNMLGRNMVRLEIHSGEKIVQPGKRIHMNHSWEILK